MHSIIYHSVITSSRGSTCLCHIITFLLAALGVNVTLGNIKPLFELDKIGIRQFSLAKMEIKNEVMLWKNRGQT